jgi:hypothetical protein
LSRSESEEPGGASGELDEDEDEDEDEEKDDDDDDDDRRAGVCVRKGDRDMRGVPVRGRVVVISPRVVMGRMGRESRGSIVRKKGKRGSIRRIMTAVVL